MQADTKKPDYGDPFPMVKWSLTDGTTVTLPDDLAGRWAVVLIYRGLW